MYRHAQMCIKIIGNKAAIRNVLSKGSARIRKKAMKSRKIRKKTIILLRFSLGVCNLKYEAVI